MPLKVNSTAPGIVVLEGTRADFFSGNVSTQDMNDEVRSINGTASDALKAIITKFNDRLIPFVGYALSGPDSSVNNYATAYPLTITNWPGGKAYPRRYTKLQFICAGKHDRMENWANCPIRIYCLNVGA